MISRTFVLQRMRLGREIPLTLHGQLGDLVARRHQRHDARALAPRLLGSTRVQQQHPIGFDLRQAGSVDLDLDIDLKLA